MKGTLHAGRVYSLVRLTTDAATGGEKRGSAIEARKKVLTSEAISERWR